MKNMGTVHPIWLSVGAEFVVQHFINYFGRARFNTDNANAVAKGERLLTARHDARKRMTQRAVWIIT